MNEINKNISSEKYQILKLLRVFGMIPGIIFRYIIVFLILGTTVLLILNYLIIPYYTYSEEIYLPNVEGIHIDKAKKILSNFDLEIHTIPYDENYTPNDVAVMHPRANRKVKKGSSISLSIVEYPKRFKLNNYNNTSLRSVQLKFDSKNLIIDNIVYEYSFDIQPGYIIDFRPKANTLVDNDDLITAIVSKGKPPDYYVVPNLINFLSLDSVKRELSKNGLKLGRISYEYKRSCNCDDEWAEGTIINQNPPPNMKLSLILPVDITLRTYNKELFNNE